ncbi:MAG: glutaminyl-tRNA synthase (glutamine-hydrolyzing) subunit B [Candidatus Staskawiczbacteria bacterium RIFCSPLOWO2_01_FULL_38_12b]|uniref:Aspartyl/glutamyl-tRNA(Asn/Gln) amidotransferase subunit B n=1 Tax=Candidatus Staskawiczbacteria bacterium RIFCSPLOWO2_01_FULL_38_12b TaxID=1802214 RepID=A0A1G2IFZ0_9BACT|nr:MAG: glutaminyl-tRNA synthase (glutamine-hydrolyzing) subunit B [Candidatus Staskawiczbacteria bacterium RIFCSPLOWO2_01_FULL_38_12b]
MYKPTIGLEIHAELNTKSKMFCSCKNDPDEARPNVNICPVCTAQPGTLPVANEEAIKKVIKTGLALHCKIIAGESPLGQGYEGQAKFDRKNYFYPDIPKGYQISQYDQPFCENGYLEIDGRKIGITRIHLEEDTGSLLHPDGAGYSLVNFNRAGVALMELVTEPDITSGVEAKKFAEELQLIFKYLGVSDADMEKGLMRVEVNISVSKINPSTPLRARKLGTKVEIKNLNSFKVVEKSIEYEIKRQTELLESGQKVVQETRGWHDKKDLPARGLTASNAQAGAQAGITFSQREKESAHDYRYFPEPDLPPLHFDKKYITGIKSQIPELPEQKRTRFKKEYGLEENQIEFFVVQKDLGEYFEKVCSELGEWLSVEKVKTSMSFYKLSANYLISDIQGLLKGKEFMEKDFKITPENFAEFIKMIYQQEINSKTAKIVLLEMYNTGVDPSTIVDENNWRQMEDDGALEKVIKEVITKNPKAVADYKAGNANAVQFLSGQVMAATRGTANPGMVQEILKKLL